MPRIEYAAPLLWQWCARHHPEGSDRAIKRKENHPLYPLAKLREACLSWVFNVRYTKVLGAIAGILDINFRFCHLAAGFAKHLSQTHTHNPIRLLFPNNYPGPWSTPTIVPLLCNHYLWLEFCNNRNITAQTEQSQTDSPQPMSLRNWLREKKITWLTNENGILAKNIQPASRGNSGLMDRVLYFRDAWTRRQAIAWRRNVFALGAWCKCGQPFRRTHVDSCDLLAGLPNTSYRPPVLSRVDNMLQNLKEKEAKSWLAHILQTIKDYT
jgi:hypothetical protein